jgi:hypothetical protein
MSDCSVVPPSSGRGCGKVNEIPCCRVVLLHDYFFKLDLGLGSVVERTKVEFVTLEQLPIAKPSRLGMKFTKNGRSQYCVILGGIITVFLPILWHIQVKV